MKADGAQTSISVLEHFSNLVKAGTIFLGVGRRMNGAQKGQLDLPAVRVARKLEIETARLGRFIGKIRLVLQQNRGARSR